MEKKSQFKITNEKKKKKLSAHFTKCNQNAVYVYNNVDN